MSEDKSSPKTLPFDHDEYADETILATLSTPVAYEEDKGIKGLANSPYVFGAAFLASFGGFSFGYGTYKMFLMLLLK